MHSVQWIRWPRTSQFETLWYLLNAIYNFPMAAILFLPICDRCPKLLIVYYIWECRYAFSICMSTNQHKNVMIPHLCTLIPGWEVDSRALAAILDFLNFTKTLNISHLALIRFRFSIKFWVGNHQKTFYMKQNEVQCCHAQTSRHIIASYAFR